MVFCAATGTTLCSFCFRQWHGPCLPKYFLPRFTARGLANMHLALWPRTRHDAGYLFAVDRDVTSIRDAATGYQLTHTGKVTPHPVSYTAANHLVSSFPISPQPQTRKIKRQTAAAHSTLRILHRSTPWHGRYPIRYNCLGLRPWMADIYYAWELRGVSSHGHG
jgi:hypothetical protein